jgi:hypothetical protein
MFFYLMSRRHKFKFKPQNTFSLIDKLASPKFKQLGSGLRPTPHPSQISTQQNDIQLNDTQPNSNCDTRAVDTLITILPSVVMLNDIQLNVSAARDKYFKTFFTAVIYECLF